MTVLDSLPEGEVLEGTGIFAEFDVFNSYTLGG
jgi:hypothetical protein